jgi:hypothetical protein
VISSIKKKTSDYRSGSELIDLIYDLELKKTSVLRARASYSVFIEQSLVDQLEN